MPCSAIGVRSSARNSHLGVLWSPPRGREVVEFVSRARAISVYEYRLQVWCTLIAFCILAFSVAGRTPGLEPALARTGHRHRPPSPLPAGHDRGPAPTVHGYRIRHADSHERAHRLKTQFTGAKHTYDTSSTTGAPTRIATCAFRTMSMRVDDHPYAIESGRIDATDAHTRRSTRDRRRFRDRDAYTLDAGRSHHGSARAPGPGPVVPSPPPAPPAPCGVRAPQN